MRVLALTRYARYGASSRLRLYQYIPRLTALGVDIAVSPLFSGEYIQSLQQGRRLFLEVAQGFWRRVQALLSMGSYDLVWIEKECLPWVPFILERWFYSKNVPYVLDYDDAVFHSYDCHSSGWVRLFLKAKHPRLMRNASMVTVGNRYLADFAKKSGAPRVDLLPTVVDLNRYPLRQQSFQCEHGSPCVGWIGQQSTARYLELLASIFQRFSSARKARFAAIGIDATALGLPMDSIPWSEETEVTSLRSFDIGIMPLIDAPFERGKCGYKLIQYMACGLPVVASPVGVNSEIVEHGVNGFLAASVQEWEQALDALIADPQLRQRMGTAGRKKVEEQYCLDVAAPKLQQWFKELVPSGGKGGA